MMFFRFRENKALADLGVSPSDLQASYRQGAQEVGSAEGGVVRRKKLLFTW
jgi:hypothetical protein